MAVPRVREVMRAAGALSAADLYDMAGSTQTAVTLAADASLLEAARTLARLGVECAPVLHDGHLIGWLTARDLVRALAAYARRVVAQAAPGLPRPPQLPDSAAS